MRSCISNILLRSNTMRHQHYYRMVRKEWKWIDQQLRGRCYKARLWSCWWWQIWNSQGWRRHIWKFEHILLVPRNLYWKFLLEFSFIRKRKRTHTSSYPIYYPAIYIPEATSPMLIMMPWKLHSAPGTIFPIDIQWKLNINPMLCRKSAISKFSTRGVIVVLLYSYLWKYIHVNVDTHAMLLNVLNDTTAIIPAT